MEGKLKKIEGEWVGGGGERSGIMGIEAWRLLTFSIFEVGANSRLGAYSNKYRITTTSFPGLSPDITSLAQVHLFSRIF